MDERSRASGAAGTGPGSALRAAFEHVARHSGEIEDTLRKFEVPARDRPDLMQHVLLSAWQSVQAGGFRPSSHLSLKKALRRWMFAVAWHHAAHYKERQRQRDRDRIAYARPEVARHAPSPFRQVEARQILRDLERLQPAVRDAVVASALGYTVEQIAAELGQNPNTVQHRVERGREQLLRTLRSKNAPTPLAIRSMLADMAPRSPLNNAA